LGYIIALSLLTYKHVVLGEMVPKTLTLDDAARIVLFIVRPMQVAEKILGVPVHLLNVIGRLLLRLFKVPAAEGESRVLSPEELELLVTESAEDGLLKEGEEEMIRNIFDFSDRVVGQVMTPRTRVQAIPSNMPNDEILKVVTESRHSRFPVFEGDLDHIAGILHLKDLVRQTLRSKGEFDLRLILRAAPSVPENYPVELLLAAFKQQRLHMAIVLDEFGGMSGVVTLEDLVEEIVGEVRDEFDLEKEPLVEVSPGVIEDAGTYLVDDLLEEIDLGHADELPDVETVGGLIVTWLGRPPVKGDEFVFRNTIHFKVMDVERRAVVRARIEFPDPNREGEEDTAVSPPNHDH
ncbi:MAG: hemolysin family protein, partial [Anaerolineae bacterium]